MVATFIHHELETVRVEELLDAKVLPARAATALRKRYLRG